MAYYSAFNAHQQRLLVLILMSGKADNQSTENTRMVTVFNISEKYEMHPRSFNLQYVVIQKLRVLFC